MKDVTIIEKKRPVVKRMEYFFLVRLTTVHIYIEKLYYIIIYQMIQTFANCKKNNTKEHSNLSALKIINISLTLKYRIYQVYYDHLNRKAQLKKQSRQPLHQAVQQVQSLPQLFLLLLINHP